MWGLVGRVQKMLNLFHIKGQLSINVFPQQSYHNSCHFVHLFVPTFFNVL